MTQTETESQTDRQGERERGSRSASVHMCSCVHMEVRAQLSGAGSFFFPSFSGIEVIRCSQKALLPDETCRQPLSTNCV